MPLFQKYAQSSHLGYAYELDSREVAMEALGLAATNYNFMHRYLDDPKYSKQPTAYQTSNQFEVLARVRADKRLDGLFSGPGLSNFNDIFSHHESILMEHWNAWKMSDPKRQFEQTQQVAVALLISAAAAAAAHTPTSSPPNQEKQSTEYDFFLLHLLTTTHSLRILLPHLPAQHHIPCLRQWFLLTLAFYISQLRPAISLQKHILDYNIQGRDWEWVVDQALKGEHSLDAHFVKGVRAIKVAAETWGDEEKGLEGVYLKAAVRFAAEFGGWGGFSAEDEEVIFR